MKWHVIILILSYLSLSQLSLSMSSFWFPICRLLRVLSLWDSLGIHLGFTWHDTCPPQVSWLPPKSIGLEVCTSLSPKSSRRDDWLLGTGRGSRPCPALVPFFPEVHEELIKSWMPPFFDQKRLVCLPYPRYHQWRGGYEWRWHSVHRCTCARKIPPLEGIVLVPRPKPLGWRPLTAKAYSAAGHACMPRLSCEYTKPSIKMHEGSTNLRSIQELHSATDIALW